MIKPLTDVPSNARTVFVRAGFDVPIQAGIVTDTSRLEAVAPTIAWLQKQGHAIVIGAHQGRPKDVINLEYSQKPVAAALEQILTCKVQFSSACTGKEANELKQALQPGEVLLLENLRFDPREKSKLEAEKIEFAKELAIGIDAYVNEAFPNCHRAHASMTSLAQLVPAYAGLQLLTEIVHLTLNIQAHTNICLVIGGAKMETKVPVIEQFIGKAQTIVVGGMIATTFQVALGRSVGASAYEQEAIPIAKDLLVKAKAAGTTIIVPTDVITAADISSEATTVTEVPFTGALQSFDIGPKSQVNFSAVIHSADLVIWNGPMGVSTKPQFKSGTNAIAQAIVQATSTGATSIVGGGDSIKYFTQEGIPINSFTFVSTGGGAMLEFIAGKKLPALTVLQ